MASLGLPGLGDFVGEFLVLLGAYRANVSLTIVATLGLLAATLYGLKFAQGAFHGPNLHHWSLPDMRLREWTILGPMILFLLWIGLYPQPVLNTLRPSLAAVQQSAFPQEIVRR
jgi:NADH-quinone oxidoreductase subunit M